MLLENPAEKVYFLKRDRVGSRGGCMNTAAFAGTLSDLLVKLLPRLLKHEDAAGAKGDKTPQELPPAVHLLLLRLQVERDPALNALIESLAASPEHPARRRSLQQYLEHFLAKNPAFTRSLEHLATLGGGIAPPPQPTAERWDRLLTTDRRVVRRLEMLYELRKGKTVKEAAAACNVSPQELFALNARFCAAGIAGLMNDEVGSWLDRLSPADTVLRRLDMIYLVRCGTPLAVVAEQYGAVPEYVERILQRFEKNGVPGILTEKEIDRYRALYPPTLRVCSYNLHGVQSDGPVRFRRIATQLADADAHVAALQEVVSGSGVQDTGAQIATWASTITGERYTSEFAYCHQFMEKYPEGIALATRCRPEDVQTFDLTELRDGLKPTMPRKALAMHADFHGRRAAVTCVHLDHAADARVRLAQVEKLVHELEEKSERTDCFILAGDFNDTEDAPSIRFLLSEGYRDAYRACNKDAGNTYPAGDPNVRIDYIFVKGAGEIRSSGLLANDPELSDHIGLFAEIG